MTQQELIKEFTYCPPDNVRIIEAYEIAALSKKDFDLLMSTNPRIMGTPGCIEVIMYRNSRKKSK